MVVRSSACNVAAIIFPPKQIKVWGTWRLLVVPSSIHSNPSQNGDCTVPMEKAMTTLFSITRLIIRSEGVFLDQNQMHDST